MGCVPTVPAPGRPVVAAVLAAGSLALALAGCQENGTSAAGGNSTSPGPSRSTSTTAATASAPTTVADDGPPTTATTAAPVTSPATGAPGTTVAGGGTVGEPGLPPNPPPTAPVTTIGTDRVASGLAADPGCDRADPARALVKLSWTPAGTGEQLVAVSTRPDGFQTGVQSTTEALAADRSSYELAGAQPGGVYYWRVLTRTTAGWAASPTAQFEGPTCVRF